MNTHAKQCSQAKAIHNGKTNIFEMKCSLCPKMFTSKKALDSHKLKNHPGVISTNLQSNNTTVINLSNGNNGLNTLAALGRGVGAVGSNGPAILRHNRPASLIQNNTQQDHLGGGSGEQSQMAKTLARYIASQQHITEQMGGPGGSSASGSEEGDGDGYEEGQDGEDEGKFYLII